MRISCYRTAWIRGTTFKCDTQQTRDVKPMVDQGWASVADAGPALIHHWFSVTSLWLKTAHTQRWQNVCWSLLWQCCADVLFFCEVGITCCIKAACALSLITITWIYDRVPWKVRLPLPESCYGLVLCSAIRAGRSCRGYAECLACQSQRARPPL